MFRRSHDPDEIHERRVPKAPPQREFQLVEAGFFPLQRHFNTGDIGIPGLYQHPPGSLRPARAAGHLGQQREGPLRGPEVGDVETGVGVRHHYQGDIGEVVTFRHHLRADQHSRPGLRERRQDRPGPRPAGKDVRVQPEHLPLRDHRPQLAVETLRARGPPHQRSLSAGRADRRLRIGASAVMAHQPTHPAVEGQRQLARRAHHDVSTQVAVDVARVSPPVEQDDGLLGTAQHRRQSLTRVGCQQGAAALPPHVHHLADRRRAGGPPREPQPGLGPGHALH